MYRPIKSQENTQKKATLLLLSVQEEKKRSDRPVHDRATSAPLNMKLAEKPIDLGQGETGSTLLQLITWIKLMWDRAGKLIKRKASGSKDNEDLSVRDKWIEDNFGYLNSYMRRVIESKRKIGG